MSNQQSLTMTIHAADLFCGAGGTSLGLAHACAEMGIKLNNRKWGTFRVMRALSSATTVVWRTAIG